MVDDQDRCEWVNVLLVPAHPGSPGQRAVKRLLYVLLLLLLMFVSCRMMVLLLSDLCKSADKC